MSFREFRLLVFPALFYLSACASTLPAPVVDLSEPTPHSTIPGNARMYKPVPKMQTGNENAVVVTALANQNSPRSASIANSRPLVPRPQESTDTTRPKQLNPAVVSLLNRANEYQRNADYARTADSLERALEIEPDSAWLWHRLALARFNQGQVGQAAALAAKSNTLIGQGTNTDQRELLADNWLLIAKVHSQRGEHIAAKAAVARASRIRSGSG